MEVLVIFWAVAPDCLSQRQHSKQQDGTIKEKQTAKLMGEVSHFASFQHYSVYITVGNTAHSADTDRVKILSQTGWVKVVADESATLIYAEDPCFQI